MSFILTGVLPDVCAALHTSRTATSARNDLRVVARGQGLHLALCILVRSESASFTHKPRIEPFRQCSERARRHPKMNVLLLEQVHSLFELTNAPR
jgi:hypothetical protein